MDIPVDSNNVILEDYQLWFDGSITIDPSNIYKFIDILDHVHVSSINNEIEQYNKIAIRPIQLKNDCNIDPAQWNIPSYYQQLDILSYITQKHTQLSIEYKWDNSEVISRLERLTLEYKLFTIKHLIPLTKALIYIINTLIDNQQVWGTGRGSSVSSYLLYVIGVHDVDSYEYDLDITDFIKMEKQNG